MMRTYKAFYKGKSVVVQAETQYQALQLAAKEFKAKKSWDVAIMLADTPVSTESI